MVSFYTEKKLRADSILTTVLCLRDIVVVIIQFVLLFLVFFKNIISVVFVIVVQTFFREANFDISCEVKISWANVFFFLFNEDNGFASMQLGGKIPSTKFLSSRCFKIKDQIEDFMRTRVYVNARRPNAKHDPCYLPQF